MRIVLAVLVALAARGDSIDVRISPDRVASVQERFSGAGPAEFVSIESPCMRIEQINAGGLALKTQGAGPWSEIAIPATASLEISYQAEPVAAPRTCSLPLLMPKHPIDSVSVTVTDLGSGLSFISVPQLTAHRDSKTWTAMFPAVPSTLRLEWETGNRPAASVEAPTGRFAWNFWGLCTILVTWIAAYLAWARRHAL